MRWLVLIVVVVIGLLFWYDPGGLVPKWGAETPAAPTPTRQLGIVATPWPFPTIYVTPIPPAERIKGVWVRVGGSERLEFGDFGMVHLEVLNGWSNYYSYQIVDNEHIYIDLYPSKAEEEFFKYKFDETALILIEQPTGDRFIYLPASGAIEPERQATKNIGPNSVTISGRLVGPAGVLANQMIILERHARPSCLNCDSTTVAAITDATGQYTFWDVKPEFDYSFSFVFNVVNPNQIRDRELVGDFVLSKRGSEITATSNNFYLSGYEAEKTVDFIYPSTPPPTATPASIHLNSALATAVAATTPLPTSTSTVQPTPPIWVQVRPRSQETTVGTPLLASMILEYYGENYTPEYLRELFIQKGKDAGRYPGNEKFYEEGGVFNQDMLDGVMSFGYNWNQECLPISGDEEFNQRRQQLVDDLTVGRPALIGLWSGSSGYNVIVVGHDPSTQTYTYLDPKQVSVGEDQLKQLWRQEVIDKSASIKTEDRCIIFTSPKS